MSDSVDTVRTETNEAAIESTIQTWLDDNSGITSLDFVKIAEEGQNYSVVTFIYTA